MKNLSLVAGNEECPGVLIPSHTINMIHIKPFTQSPNSSPFSNTSHTETGTFMVLETFCLKPLQSLCERAMLRHSSDKEVLKCSTSNSF
jgi:hypothetical protein